MYKALEKAEEEGKIKYLSSECGMRNLINGTKRMLTALKSKGTFNSSYTLFMPL